MVRRTGLKSSLFCIALSIATCQVAPAQHASQNAIGKSVNLSLVSDEFDIPVHITANPFRPDEIVVVERDGLAKRLSKIDHTVRDLLDIEILVHETHPHGLMSLAYSNKMDGDLSEFFVNYIDTQGDLVVARFPDNRGKLVDDEQLSVVLKVARITPNPHGSQLYMNLDNSLIVTTGDGEEAPSPPSHAAQSPKSLLGKVLRITPQRSPGYTIPSNNPFQQSKESLPEIWALGFRNPDSVTVDPETNQIYVIDNGPNWHEINLVEAGKNYGWDTMEGSDCVSQPCPKERMTTPIVKIQRSSGRSRVIGGVLYRGKRIPQLQGSFIFAESSTGAIFAAERNPDSSWRYSVLATITKKEVSAIGADANGEVFIATRDGQLFEMKE